MRIPARFRKRRDEQPGTDASPHSADHLLTPSFQRLTHARRRFYDLSAQAARPLHLNAIGKLGVYDLVAAHGIAVPTLLGRWDALEDIAWDELPDLVVVKSSHGSRSHGVLPLRRRDGGWQIVTRKAILATEDLVERLRTANERGFIRAPYYAEEFVGAPTGAAVHGKLVMPVDVKAYAFYGEVPLFLLRRVTRHGHKEAAFRVVDASGADVLDHYRGEPTDPTIPLPSSMAACIDVAARVSVIAKVPFLRVDLYDTGDRVMLGEVTPAPGGAQWFGERMDRDLGEVWERAEVRLWHDLLDREDA